MMDIEPGVYDFLKIIISVFLGMFGKSLYDFLQRKRELKRDKEFIMQYLKNAKKVFPILKENYEKVKELIPNNDYTVHELKQFEGFNTEVLKSISFPRYYHIFKENASTLFEIYHMVNALEEDLPILIYTRYLKSLREIDSNSNSEDEEVVVEMVQLQMNLISANIDFKLKEIKLLQERINTILNLKV
jgi:hypothetical protein